MFVGPLAASLREHKNLLNEIRSTAATDCPLNASPLLISRLRLERGARMRSRFAQLESPSRAARARAHTRNEINEYRREAILSSDERETVTRSALRSEDRDESEEASD